MKSSWKHWTNRVLKISVLIVGNFLTGCGGCGNDHTSSTPAGAAQYNIVDLGTLTPTGINNNTQIVGNVLSGSTSRPAFWQNGALTMLQNLNGPDDFANAINDAGQIVGHAGGTAAADPTYHAVLWASSSAVPTALPVPAGATDKFSDATAINSSGDVVGFGDTLAFTQHAIAWPHGASAGVILPGPIGSISSALWSVNASGQTVGISISDPLSLVSTLILANINSSTAEQDLGIRLQTASTVHITGSVDIPVYINALGTIVGPQGTNGGFAFIRLSNGQVTQITSSPNQSAATGINGAGTVIVDINPDSAGQTPNCGVYDTVHGLRDLNTLVTSGSGWQLQFASGINDKGQIVGSGQFQGSTHGFLLTPVTTSN